MHGIEGLAILEDGSPGSVLVLVRLGLLLLLHTPLLSLGALHSIVAGLPGGGVLGVDNGEGVPTSLIVLDHLDWLGLYESMRPLGPFEVCARSFPKQSCLLLGPGIYGTC